MKRNEILTHAPTRVNLEHVMLSKRSQTQGFHLHRAPKVVKLIERESGVVVARGCGERGVRSYCLVETDFQSGKMKKFWKWMVAFVAQHRKCT